MFAQVRGVPGEVCKIADDSLPRFESWTCHPQAQVRPGARARPGGMRERCSAPSEQAALADPLALASPE